MDRIVRPVKSLEGSLRVPSDKSIAHRAAIVAAVSDGPSRIERYPRGQDTLTTVDCLSRLGVESRWDGDTLIINGVGLFGLQAPEDPIDCGNSGTTMRLLAGLLAGQLFDSTLVGDASLMARPMRRVAEPLREMGAQISLDDGKAPIRIHGRGPLTGIEHTLSVPSAQVKSAIILAALTANGPTTIFEPQPSRDHTERLLGLDTSTRDGVRSILVSPIEQIAPSIFSVPGDFSSAAFLLVAASILPGARLTLRETGVNPTRAAAIDVLRSAGAEIELSNPVDLGAEEAADILVQGSQLQAFEIQAAIVPKLVDEVPILAVAASQASGESRFEGLAELRAKESDRLTAVDSMLRSMGANPSATADSLVVRGKTKLSGAVIDSLDDHRIAMAAGVAGLVASGLTTVRGAECTAISYPAFWDDLKAVSVV